MAGTSHPASKPGIHSSTRKSRVRWGSPGLPGAPRDEIEAIIRGLLMSKTIVESSTQIRRPELKLAKRMSRLGTETAFEVLVRARALEAKGKDIIHLEIGEPDFDTPSNVVDAGVKALKGGWTHYGPSAGLPALRKAIAEDVSKSRGIKVAPEEVVVGPGGKAS